MKYRKLPVVIEAIQLSLSTLDEVKSFLGNNKYSLPTDQFGIIIETLEGEHLARLGDYVIKGVKGEFYPCKPDIFEMTYEPAE